MRRNLIFQSWSSVHNKCVFPPCVSLPPSRQQNAIESEDVSAVSNIISRFLDARYADGPAPYHDLLKN